MIIFILFSHFNNNVSAYFWKQNILQLDFFSGIAYEEINHLNKFEPASTCMTAPSCIVAVFCPKWEEEGNPFIISINIIRNRLAEKKCSSVSTFKTLLTETHMQKQLSWMRGVTNRDWSVVFFRMKQVFGHAIS